MSDFITFCDFMQIAGFECESKIRLPNDNLVVYWKEAKKKSSRFTKIGHDGFLVGGEFTKRGKLLRGYLDCHLEKSSKNNDYIFQLLHGAVEGKNG